MGSIGAVLDRLNPFGSRHRGDEGLNEQITYDETKETQTSTADEPLDYDLKDHSQPVQTTGTSLEHDDLPRHFVLRDRAARLYNESRESYADLLRSRHSALNTHAEVQISLRRYLQLRSSVRDSQRELCQVLRIARAEGSWAQFSDQLCEKSELLEADFNSLEAHVARLQTCQGRLANLEFTVRERENGLFSALESLARAIGVIDEPDYGETWFMEGIDQKTRSTESTHLNPLLEVYYDKAGDAGLLRDILNELDFDYLEAKKRRNILLIDQDRAPGSPDSHFDQDYRNERAKIAGELEAATRGAEEAKRSCLDAGLQPETSQCCTSEPTIQFPEPFFGHDGDARRARQSSSPRATGRLGPSYLRSKLTVQHLEKQDRESFRRHIKDSLSMEAELDQRTQDVAKWASHLGISPPERPSVPERHEIEALRDFRSDLESSFEHILPPRRRSSIGLIDRIEMSVSQGNFHASSPMNRLSLPSDLKQSAEIFKPRSSDRSA